MRHLNKIVPALFTVLLLACSQKPAEIRYGNDECTHCHMIITDPKFVSEIVTAKGKVLKFDAIECMAGYLKDHKKELDNAKLWVTDFNKAGTWMEAQQAHFVKSSVIKSPMGQSLLALETTDELNSHIQEYPGKALSWVEVMKL